MKKSFLTIILSFIGISTWAYDVKVNGIYYNVIDKAGIAEVTYGDSEYTGKVSVPSSITSNGKTYAVTAIGDRAFNNCWGLSSVTLPNSIETIKDWAFSYCSLNAIEIPNSVSTIRDAAFQGALLTSVSIPNSVTSLGYNAFLGCEQMESVSIPNSVKSIGSQAFRYCTKLKSVSIPNSMTGIEWGTFSGCESLTSVEFPSTLLYIGDISFQGCTNLSSIDLPNSVVGIGYDAFKNCGLTSVSIPSSVTYIGNNAFWNCYKMTSVTLPNSLTNVGTEVFGLDAGIKEINITCTDEKDFAKYISRADIINIFFSGLDTDNLIHNIIVDGKKQTEINIPSTVRTIGEYAFINCPSITSVIIPRYVRNIGNGAFEGCKNLETVTCYATTVPTTNENAFKDALIKNSTLIVPKSALQPYKSQTPWKDFGTINTIPEKCGTPTIKYVDGKIVFSTKTAGAKVVSKIESSDIQESEEFIIPLTATYNITAYATMEGEYDSDIATASLIWLTAEDIEDGIEEIQVKSTPLLISMSDGTATISGVADGTIVEIYTISGTKVASGTIKNGFVSLNLSSVPEQVVIIKAGNRSAKYMVK